MKRNFGLDIMRSVSIWLVLLQHLGVFIPGLAPLRLGGIGVEIFFVLSGFLIGGIIFKEIDKNNSFFNTLKNFWIRRWYRILPLYYLALLVKFVFIDHSIGSNIIYYIFFLQNNFYGIQFMDVTWSLVIEEWFYLISPIFLILTIRVLKNDKKIMAAILLFMLMILILRTYYVYLTNAPYVGVNGNFPFRFDSLFMGVSLAYLRHNKWGLFSKMQSFRYFIMGFALFLSYIILFQQSSLKYNNIDDVLFFRTLGFMLLPFSIALFIPYTASLQIDAEKNLLNKSVYRFITTTSVITYAMYLVHPFVNQFLDRFNFETYSVSRFGSSLLLTYLISLLVYTFFEKPILNYRDRKTAA